MSDMHEGPTERSNLVPGGADKPQQNPSIYKQQREAAWQQSADKIANAESTDRRLAEINETLMEIYTTNPEAERFLGEYMKQGDFPDGVSQHLCEYEQNKKPTDPSYRVTDEPLKRLAFIMKMGSKDNEDTKDIKKEQNYQSLIQELDHDPKTKNLDAVSRIQLLLSPKYVDRVPPFEKAKLSAFAKILDIAAAMPADERAIKERLNTQDFSAGVPDPIIFLQTEIFSEAEEGGESGISDATQQALAREFKITPIRIRNASELQDETLRSTIDPETGKASYIYTEKAPLMFRPGVGAYPDSQGREYITATNQHGEVLTKDITHMSHDQRSAYADFVQLWTIFSGGGLPGHMAEVFKLRWFGDASMIGEYELQRSKEFINALKGGMAGFDGTIFSAEEEGKYFAWTTQWFSPKGDAVANDFDYVKTRHDLTHIGLMDVSGKINLKVLQAAGSYMRSHYGKSEPSYNRLHRYLYGLFPDVVEPPKD